MNVVGKRADGVLLVDIGTKTMYAVNTAERTFADLGDVTTRGVPTQWSVVDRAEAQTYQPEIRHTLDRGRRVDPRVI